MDIMLDLETFGKGNNAAIVQLGAVAFDRRTGKIESSTFLQNISADSCLAIGLQMDGNTVEWWLKQSPEAQNSIINPPGKPIKGVLDDFNT